MDLRKLAADLKDNTTLEILNLSCLVYLHLYWHCRQRAPSDRHQDCCKWPAEEHKTSTLKFSLYEHCHDLSYASDTSLGDEGAKIVADLLESNTSIQHIDLSGMAMTITKLTSRQSNHFSWCYCHCQHFVCQHLTPISEHVWYKIVCHLFWLPDNNIRDTGAAAIATSPGKLQFLGLSSTSFSNIALTFQKIK